MSLFMTYNIKKSKEKRETRGMNEFGQKLKNLRLSEKMTQQELATRLGVGRTTIVEYENGKIYPPHTRLVKIAKIFNVQVDYLTGTENLQTLNERDKKDISKRLSNIIDALDADGDLMFDGAVMDDETRDLLRASLENSFNVGKMIAKQKYTPKKRGTTKRENAKKSGDD